MKKKKGNFVHTAMSISIDSSATLFAVVLVVLHILIVGGLFVYLCLQAPKKRVTSAVSLDERAAIRREMRKGD